MSPLLAYLLGVATIPALMLAVGLYYAVRFACYEAYLLVLVRRSRRRQREEEARERAEDEQVCRRLVEIHEMIQREKAERVERLVQEIQRTWEEEA